MPDLADVRTHSPSLLAAQSPSRESPGLPRGARAGRGETARQARERTVLAASRCSKVPSWHLRRFHFGTFVRFMSVP